MLFVRVSESEIMVDILHLYKYLFCLATYRNCKVPNGNLSVKNISY